MQGHSLRRNIHGATGLVAQVDPAQPGAHLTRTETCVLLGGDGVTSLRTNHLQPEIALYF
jgi:hypothetical protein